MTNFHDVSEEDPKLLLAAQQALDRMIDEWTDEDIKRLAQSLVEADEAGYDV